ncbi:DUF4268 domain-containing protein [Desulforhopalus singaporensis]|uniref:DUF4268 domain-containing protein n=1 Tax=Desulforhopalus singaporensis TaxID=91360 RepID=A0A1H0VUX5_9BACT|nr:DUF4268 domain-containing protein [Desulforhopalus singaporensis]SDP81945.1 protein of unknown function [Desulforhopalus singaporensis]
MSSEQEKRFFWKQFLDVAKQTTDLYQNSAIRKNKHYIHISTGMAGLYYSTTCKLNESWVEVCIQRKDDSEELYDDIKRHQQIIEHKFGEPLRWVNEGAKQRCKIMTCSVPRGRADHDITGLSRILAERTMRFYDAIHQYLPAQNRVEANAEKQPTAAKTNIRSKAHKVVPEKKVQLQSEYIYTAKNISAVEALFKKSMECRSCFERGMAVQANIDIAQPRLIGKNYFSSIHRIMIIALNPGAGNSPEKRKSNKNFSQWLHDYRDGKKSLDELFAFQTEYMQCWGTPPGRYLHYYCDGLGLLLANIAMANIAWCADANNRYPAGMLNECFSRHTEPLIKLLAPSIVILSGGPAHKFTEKIKQVLPGCSVIKTLHYAHREGRHIEEQHLRSVREQIAQYSG